MPDTFATRAAVLRAFGQPMEIEPVRLRRPGPHEAIVRVTAAGVCHSDVGQADGEWAAPLPLVLGHEGAGIVEAVGSEVDIAVGTRVQLNMAPGCGHCRFCSVGRPILCPNALDAMSEARLLTGPSPFSDDSGGPIGTYALLGCFAEHVVVQARSLVPLPDDISDDVGALLGCAVITGVGAAIATIDVPAGSRGAVFGAGGVGAGAIQGAAARGAGTVIAIDPSGERRTRALGLGATHGWGPEDEQIDALRADARDVGLDWTIVSVGSTAAIRTAIDVLRPGGVACIVGLTREGDATHVDMLDLVTFEKRIIGSAYGTESPSTLVPRILELQRSGRLDLEGLVGDRVPLEHINEAFVRSRSSEGLRTLVHMSSTSVN